MKAILVEALTGPENLVYREHQLPDPEPDQILIEVKYAGVNFPDILISQGKYQFQPELPFSPGGEVAGIVKQVGSDVTDFKPGDRVVSGTSWGGFAEEVLGLARNTFLLPDEVELQAAAASLMTHGTVMHALKDRAQLQSGEMLVVLGASGGVGTAAIQLGKWMGANVIACASTQEKLDYCLELGADHGYLYTDGKIKETIKELTRGKGADVIFDPVGGDYAEPAFRSIAPMGRYLVVGFASGSVPAIPLNLPLLKTASLVGVFWGNFFRYFPKENSENIQLLMKLLAEQVIQPQVDKVFELKDATQALQYLQARKVHGKVLLAP